MTMYIVPDAYGAGMQQGKLFDNSPRFTVNDSDEDKKVEDTFTTGAVTGLVGLWRAIKKLSTASQDLFITLLDETDIINERIEKMNTRIDVVAPRVKKLQQMTPLLDLKGLKAKSIQFPSKQFIFTKNSMVRSLKMKYEECPTLPNIQSLDSETASLMPPLDEKMKTYSLLYSNPLYIYYMWQEATQKAYEEEVRERKQRRAQRRAERQRIAEEKGMIETPKKKEVQKITLYRNQLNKHGAIGELLEKQGISLSSPSTTCYTEARSPVEGEVDTLTTDQGEFVPQYIPNASDAPSLPKKLPIVLEQRRSRTPSHTEMISPDKPQQTVSLKDAGHSSPQLPSPQVESLPSPYVSFVEEQSIGQPLVNPSARKESPPSPTIPLTSENDTKKETGTIPPPPPPPLQQPSPNFSDGMNPPPPPPPPPVFSSQPSSGIPPPPPPPSISSISTDKIRMPKLPLSSSSTSAVKKTPVSPANDLMNQIKLGMNLKKIDREEIQRHKAASPPTPKGGHDLLLDSIKKGITLKRAADRILAEKPKVVASDDVPMDVASILQAGLEKKFASVGDSSEDDDSFDSDSDDEDWM